MKPDHPVTFKPETAADAWLGLLAARGVEYLFANGGTDFAPVVEAYAKGQKLGWRLPEIVIVPHENMGVAMAHGYAMATPMFSCGTMTISGRRQPSFWPLA